MLKSALQPSSGCPNFACGQVGLFPDTDFSLREEGASGGGGPAGELSAVRGQ